MLIKRTKNIVLAKVVQVSNIKNKWRTEYVFENLKNLKGKLPMRFTMQGIPPYKKQGETDFHRHSDKTFWQSGGGRVSNDTDCEIRPNFRKGGVYLIFYDKPFHRKSFERINQSDGDQWFDFVKKHILQNSPKS